MIVDLPYEVRLEDKRLVEGWAQQRLPFDPKDGWKKDFKVELGAAIRRLVAGPHEGLHATYTNPQTDRVDIENALIYNVGTSAFRNSAHTQLKFERSFDAPASPRAHLEHYYRYEIVPLSEPLSAWRRGSSLVDWSSRLASLSFDTKAAVVWWATKHGEIKTHVDSPHAGWFGLQLEVEAPETAGNLADFVKPLTDGAIAALQSHAPGPDLAELAERVARSLGVNPAAVAQALCDESTAVLSGNRILWKRGIGVQWNPADERCVAGILRRTGSSSAEWVVRGKLFHPDPRS
ncbi:MAG: hypothetical protein H0W55_07355 [Actinobacteria bacterium]|nr:hypothetical protein [Actinomycetota bacterium]MDQ3531237.1 hypothetical protein [Actinomycetota bacterium]